MSEIMRKARMALRRADRPVESVLRECVSWAIMGTETLVVPITTEDWMFLTIAFRPGFCQ